MQEKRHKQRGHWSSAKEMTMELRDRYRGSLLGLAVGDALGTTLEFSPPGSFAPLEEMVGGGPFALKPGEWTDDTSMALCLTASLVERHGFDAHDQMQRYLRWRDEGYMSSIGTCFDIGGTVSSSLSRFEATGDPFAGSTHPHAAGNGSIMRLAPVPLFYASQPQQALEKAADSSRTTHGAQAAVDACRYLGALLVGAVQREASRIWLRRRVKASEELNPAAIPACSAGLKARTYMGAFMPSFYQVSPSLHKSFLEPALGKISLHLVTVAI